MTAIGLQDAGSELPKLIGRIAQGEPVLLTQGGKPVAMVVAPPPAPAVKTPDARKLVEEMLAARDGGGPTLGSDLSVRELIEEGRP